MAIHFLYRRRDFILALAAAAAAWPLAARAQQRERVRRIAWLGAGRADEPSPYLESLRAGLRDLGWSEGRNLTISLFLATGLDNMEAMGREVCSATYSRRCVPPARDLSELETASRAIVADRCDALVVFPDSAMYEISDHIARFALGAKLPSVSGWSSFANKGLLVTYGPNVRSLYRSLAGYVDRILRGTAPADP